MDWKKAIGAVAPVLARAVGGPIGGAAIGALAKALGVEPTEDALEKKVASMTAGDLLALKTADQTFQKDMRALDIDLEKVDAEDRANARAREIATKDWMPRVLAMGVFLLFSFVVYSLQHSPIAPENRDAFNQILGILYAAVTGVLGYYFGSSAGSRAKDATVAGLSKK